jgi:hypothetical protein
MNVSGHDDLDGPWWADVERLLVAHQVDLCLWGHVHNVRHPRRKRRVRSR